MTNIISCRTERTVCQSALVSLCLPQFISFKLSALQFSAHSLAFVGPRCGRCRLLGVEKLFHRRLHDFIHLPPPLKLRRDESFSVHCFTPNRPSTCLRMFSSILMSGGHERLKPSPGNFFFASMPSLLPMAILLVALSSASAWNFAGVVHILVAGGAGNPHGRSLIHSRVHVAGDGFLRARPRSAVATASGPG